MTSPAPIYLSTRDLERIRPSAVELCDAIDRAYRCKTPENVLSKPKLAIPVAAGHQFQALCCAVRDPPYAVCKWVSVANSNRDAGLPTIHSQLLLTAFNTGEPLAIISADRLTAIRTAATSMAAARRLAKPDSRSIGFIGSGIQALAHLDLVPELFPSVADAFVLSGARRSEHLCERAQTLGLRAHLIEDPRLVLDEADLIVTSVPEQEGLEGFLDARDVKLTSFVAAVDLGRSWIADSLRAFGQIYTDDMDQSLSVQSYGKIADCVKFSGDLAQLVEDDPPSRLVANSGRTCFLAPGFALSDLAIAVLYYEIAQSKHAGLIIET